MRGSGQKILGGRADPPPHDWLFFIIYKKFPVIELIRGRHEWAYTS
jgi:hypothetical protein